MGVKGLFKIIVTFAPDSIMSKHMSEYRETIQALDASLILYKYCLPNSRKNGKLPTLSKNCYLDTCLHKTCTMLKYGVMPAWVFDGKFPEIKSHTVNKRRKIRQEAQKKLDDPLVENKIKYIREALRLSRADINDVKYLLNLMGIAYIESIEEADSQCAALNIANVTNGVISEDWDMLLFGCETLLKNFFDKSKVVEINVKILLNRLEMNLEQLIDLSAILGNDYCKGIIGIGPIEIFKKFKEYNYDMYIFLDKISKDKYIIPNDFIECWQKSKNYYMNSLNKRVTNTNILWKQPDYSEIYEYLVNEKNFPKNVINEKICELQKMYSYYINHNNKLGPYNVIRRISN